MSIVADVPRLSGPALRGFFKIAEKWDLSIEDQMKILGVTSRTTLNNWKKSQDVALSGDTLERISYVLGIFRALRIIFGDASAAHEWIRRPNKAPLFGGASALEKMTAGKMANLVLIRQYLDAERGAWA